MPGAPPRPFYLTFKFWVSLIIFLAVVGVIIALIVVNGKWTDCKKEKADIAK